MNKFILRQPIKSLDGITFGYEILFNFDNELYNQNNNYVVTDTISSFLLQNSNKIFSKEVTFMTFTPNLLFRNIPNIFKHRELVIQIEDNVIVHPLAKTVIKRYKEQGYKICINDFQFIPRYFDIIEYADYIKVNINVVNDTSSVNNLLKLSKGFNKKCIITGINNKELFEKAKEIMSDYYEGSYIAEAMVTKVNKSEYLQSNFFQLVIAVTKDEPNIDEIEEIISRDANLTYALLKMVNSIQFSLRNKTSSIKQALTILGINELKQWVYLLSLDQKSTDKASEEILKISFLRAKFCSELSRYIKNINITKSEAYLLGMFSTMNAIIDAPVEEIISELSISDEIKNAIISQDGISGTLYKLIISYEKANWREINVYTEELGIPKDMIAQIYFNCVESVNETWENFMRYESSNE